MTTIETRWGYTLSDQDAARFTTMRDRFAIQGPAFNRPVRDSLADVLLAHDAAEADYWLTQAEALAARYTTTDKE